MDFYHSAAILPGTIYFRRVASYSSPSGRGYTGLNKGIFILVGINMARVIKVYCSCPVAVVKPFLMLKGAIIVFVMF